MSARNYNHFIAGVEAAPKARKKVARGKRSARRPWVYQNDNPALKGRKEDCNVNIEAVDTVSTSLDVFSDA